jgi:hypothetical protein
MASPELPLFLAPLPGWLLGYRHGHTAAIAPTRLCVERRASTACRLTAIYTMMYQFHQQCDPRAYHIPYRPTGYGRPVQRTAAPQDRLTEATRPSCGPLSSVHAYGSSAVGVGSCRAVVPVPPYFGLGQGCVAWPEAGQQIQVSQLEETDSLLNDGLVLTEPITA